MVISNPLKGSAKLPVENDVLNISRPISISWQNDSNLPDRCIWSLIATPITVFLKAQGYLALLFRRHILGQFICLPVELNSRMGAI
jgi:hypothetical protein